MRRCGAIVRSARAAAFVGGMAARAASRNSHAGSPSRSFGMSANNKDMRKAWSVLVVSTLGFTVCFMVWMMFGVIGIPIRKTLNLNATEFGLLTAMPVLTGSRIRVPLGIWTDK